MLALLAMLLVSPSAALLLAPVAGLLIVSAPANPRAWRWALLAGVLLGVWVGWSQGIVEQTANAAAIFMTGGFIVLSRSPTRSVSHRAVLAAVLGLVAVAVWFVVWDIRWHDLQFALTREWWSVWRELAANPRFGPQSLDAQELIQRIAAAGESVARLYPARLAIGGMLGLALASTWVERIAGRPVGRPIGTLAAFRLNDHLVWLVIAAILIVLLPTIGSIQALALRSIPAALGLSVLEYWSGVAINVLVVAAALYAARGAGVLSRLLRPGLAFILAVFATVFLLPFTLVALVLLGLADTWVKFEPATSSE